LIQYTMGISLCNTNYIVSFGVDYLKFTSFGHLQASGAITLNSSSNLL